MRIYFTGCHGSGKTTLARYVSEQYNFPLITEVARMILSEKELQIDSLRSNLAIADDYQNEIFHRQILEEKNKNNFVSDRSAIDSLAYCAQHTRILDKLMKSKDLEDYVNNLKNKDALIFFIRPSKITLKEDGVREYVNWDAAVSIDGMLKILYKIFNIPYFQIDTCNMQERVNNIDNILSIFFSSINYTS